MRAKRLKSTEYTDVAGVAQRLGVGKMTVYRLVDSGELGSVRVGRKILIPEEAYERFLVANTRQGRTPLLPEAVAP